MTWFIYKCNCQVTISQSRPTVSVQHMHSIIKDGISINFQRNRFTIFIPKMKKYYKCNMILYTVCNMQDHILNNASTCIQVLMHK